MAEFIDQLLQNYGQLAMLVLLLMSGIGIAIGEDLIIIPAGLFVAEGRWSFLPTYCIAYLGVLTGDIMWFTLCRRYGWILLHKKWFKRMVHPRRLLEVKHQFDVRGAWVIVFARFIPGTRTSVITVAGLLHMSFWRFLIAEAPCILISVLIQMGVGMLIYHGYRGLSEENAKYVFWAIGIIAAGIALFFLIRWYLQHRLPGRARRARAKWLRFGKRRKTAAT